MSNIDNKHTEAPKYCSQTFYIGEKGKKKDATITEEGKISIDGKTYSVKFGGDGATKLTTEQQKELAARVLGILENTGKNFETLNKMSIQSDKIVHYTLKGKEQTLLAKDSDGKNWAKTAQKTFERFNKIINKNSDNSFEDDKFDEYGSKSDEIELHENKNFEDQFEDDQYQSIPHNQYQSIPHNQNQIQYEESTMPIKQHAIISDIDNEPVQGKNGNDLKIELVKRENKEVVSQKISNNEQVQMGKEPILFGVPLDMQMSNHKLSNKVIRFVEIGNQSIGNKREEVSQPPIKNPQFQRQEISSVIRSPGSPQQLAKTVVKTLGSGIEQKIEEFKNAHPEKIKYLQEKGWVGAKNALGSKMEMAQEDLDGTMVSFAQFRDEANKLVHSLINEVAVQLGVGETDTKIFGTPGYNSDKDISLVSKDPNKPLTTADMVLLKTVADLLTTEVVGVLPGTALDTEWYVELKFMGKEVQDREQLAKLATLDMAMSIVQAKEGLKNDNTGWNEFKQRDLDQSTDSVKVVKEKLYESVEKFYESIEEAIARELVFQEALFQENGEDPAGMREGVDSWSKQEIEEAAQKIKNDSSSDYDKKYYNAKVLSQYSKLMELGAKCGQLEKEIEGLKQKNPPDQNVIDQKIIEHDILYALINSRQPEGTMSSSELATTLFSSLGQQPTRSKEKATVEGKEILSKVGSKDLVGKNLAKLKDSYKEVEDKREMGKPYEISQLILSGQERLGQFVHVISHDYNAKDLINAGKYCLRVAESNYFSLKQVQKQGLPKQKTVEEDQKKLEEFNKLLNEAEGKYFEAKQLEQSKRKFNLNALSTGELINSRLKELKLDNENVLEKLAPRLKEFEGALANESISKEEKLSNLCVFLKKANCLNKGNSETISFGGRQYLLPKDFQLRTILQAYAGYDRKDFEQGAGGTTLKQLTDSLNNNTSKNFDVLSTINEFQKIIKNQLTEPIREKINDFNNLLKKEDLKPEQKKEYEKQRGELSNKLKGFNEVVQGLESAKENLPENYKEKLLDLGKELQKEIVEIEVGRTNDLHKKGEEIVVKNTIENHGAIKNFAEGVEGFSRKVQNFMFDNNFMPKLVSDVEIFEPWLK